jgi:Zn-dependent protease with chaperone function
MYYLLGIAVTFSGFFVIHTSLAAIAAAVARIGERRARSVRPSVGAGILLWLNLLPMAVAAIGAMLLATSFVLYEPAHADESVGGVMGICSVLGALGLLRAGWKFLAVRRATRSLIRDWEAGAAPASIPGWEGSALRLDHPFPLIAVVGIRQPRLFVAAKVLDHLGGDEIAAAVAHERGHLAARDNLKRVLVNFCAEAAFWVPGASAMRRAWADAAEQAADEYAVAEPGSLSLSLASALVKLARLAPAGTGPAMPTGAFLVEAAGDILARRVVWLAHAEGESGRGRRTRLAANLALGGGMVVFALLLVGVAGSGMLSSLHQLIEFFVQ